jgi:transposase
MRGTRTSRVGMTPLSADLRWRVIWLTQLRNYSAKKIARVLSISCRTVCRIRSCFRRTGEVLEHGQAARRPRVLTPELDRALVDLVIDTPESTAKEHYESFCAAHNLDVHYSTICRALARLGYTCKTLRGYCRSRDEQAALAFKAHIVSTFSPKQLFFLDETAKDPRALNRRFGWAMRGGTPIHSCGMIGRGQRHSALCGFDVKGFVNWYITTGTFNKERFLDAFKATVVSAVYQCHPCCPRRCCGGRQRRDSPTPF